VKHTTYPHQTGLTIPQGGRSLYQRGGKRVLDLGLTLVFSPLILVLTGLLWLMIWGSGGPGLFGHQRIGRDAVPFLCWKLRSMIPDAQTQLQTLLSDNPDAAREWAAHYKLKNDPRITRLGRFLRKSSLDELPQFWNVLKGEMSLVGPRPILPEELVKYRGATQAYLSCRPGITGLWQVSGRSDASYAQRVALDMNYLTRQSLFGDLGILLRTIGTVLRKTGV
jgi:exopolysaccharide production protein ExoY